MSAYVIDSQLFGNQFSTPSLRAIFSDESTVQRWLDVEAALAKVQGEMGIIPVSAADEIRRKARVELIDLQALSAEMARTSHPIVPLLRAMKQVCEGDSGEYIHWGATTQDIIDTGTMLQIRDALVEIERDQQRLLQGVLGLARRHRDTTMVGRSHGQHALPITFGFKAAVWGDEIARNVERIAQMKERVLVGQFSGAVGTLAALGKDGLAVQEKLFDELGLRCPNIAWHVARDRISELVTTLAITTSTIGKIAHEIYCLQKTETAELEEPFETGKVGSSTMPHKRNPPTCETIVAISRIVRGTVPLALEASVTEHERDKIGLQTEREFISKVCCMTAAAVAKLCAVIEGLSVRQENMERNLYLQKGMLLSEAVMMKLGLVLGRQEAHEIVYRICMDAFESGCTLKEGLMADPQVATRISSQEIDAMLDPHAYVGLASSFVDRVAGSGD